MVLVERGRACNLSRTVMLIVVLVSHLCGRGFAADLRYNFPLTDTAESEQDNFYRSIGYGPIGSVIRRNLIRKFTLLLSKINNRLS